MSCFTLLCFMRSCFVPAAADTIMIDSSASQAFTIDTRRFSGVYATNHACFNVSKLTRQQGCGSPAAWLGLAHLKLHLLSILNSLDRTIVEGRLDLIWIQ